MNLTCAQLLDARGWWGTDRWFSESLYTAASANLNPPFPDDHTDDEIIRDLQSGDPARFG